MAERASVIGGDVVAKNLRKVQRGFIAEVNKDMLAVRRLLDQRVTERISLSDHSLEDLAALGHPYARRAPQRIHDPDWSVHTQGGALLGGKYSGVEAASVDLFGGLKASAYVGISESVRHALFVILGTSKMVPRDFLTGSLEEVRGQAVEILRRSLRNAVVTFRGEEVRL